MKIAVVMALPWVLACTAGTRAPSQADAVQEWQLMSSIGPPPEPNVSYIVGAIAIHHPINDGRDVETLAYQALMREHIRFDMSTMKNQTCFSSQSSLGYLVARILKADSKKHHYFVKFEKMYE